MKLVNLRNRLNSSSQRDGCHRAAAVRVLFYSTETQTTTSPPPKKVKDTLYKRISPIGDPSASVVPILDKWIKEGNTINKFDLVSMVKKLRVYRRYKHALEISQWMSDRRYMSLTPGEMSIRLDLISKVHGIDEAEKYFNTIPKQRKGFQTYGALLSCYSHNKSLQKAEALMEEMRDLGYNRSPLNYNVMLNLYSRVGQYEKLDAIMEEMEQKGIHGDKFTFSIRLSAYGATGDTDGISRTLKKMEDDSEIVMDWNCYVVAANGYIKVGKIDIALQMLKKAETLITGNKRKVAYDFLLTLYTITGKKDEVYRIWKLYKSSERVFNTGYLCMINSLLKLDDFDGAEKIFEEWESAGTSYDFRVTNLLIGSYCNRGLLGKAEMVISKAIEKGHKPYATTWDILATAYLDDNQIPKATETMKKAILANRPGWKPNRVTLAACLEYLKGKEGEEGKGSEADLISRMEDLLRVPNTEAEEGYSDVNEVAL